LNRLKRLVNHTTEQAKKAGYGGLVLIIDSLERMPLKILDDNQTNHHVFFLEHADQLKALPCHLVYTVPVSLLNNRNLGNAYSDIDLIPMVKISTPDGERWSTGRDLLYEMVSKRIEISSIFSDEDLVYKLVNECGGVVRDLMRLLLFAADYTAFNQKIGEPAIDKAIRKLRREYDDLIHQEDLPLLVEIARNPYVGGSERLSWLMYNRLVLPFVNAERWIELHPAVRESPKLRAYIKFKSQLEIND
jgi:hypothetical protein